MPPSPILLGGYTSPKNCDGSIRRWDGDGAKSVDWRLPRSDLSRFVPLDQMHSVTLSVLPGGNR